MRLLVSSVFGTGILGLATSAFAQAAPPPASDPASPRGFMMMDVDGEQTKLELDTGITIPTADGLDGVLFTPRLRVQGIVAPSFALYGALQMAAFVGDNGEAGASNPEIGAIYHARVSPNADLSLHGGAVLGVFDGDATVAAGALLVRPSDLVMSSGDWWLRGGGSAGYHGGGGFFRVDAGVDQHLGGSGGLDTLVHINAGFGFGNAEWTSAFEAQVLIPVGEGNPDSIQTFGVSLHHHGPKVTPFVGLSLPVGNNFGFDVLTISTGAAFAL